MTDKEVNPILEISLDEVPGEEFEVIKSALMDSQWKYRSVSGIHEETGVRPEHVAAVLDHSGLARRTVFTKEPGGQALYARATQPKTFREQLEEIRWTASR